MKTIPIAFDYVSGSHTGEKIKQQYESVIKVYDIDKKIFKIVCDQAANNKKAFKSTLECTDEDHLIKITTMLLEKQRKLDMIEEKKQTTLRTELEKEKNIMNKPINGSQTKITAFMKRDKVLIDLDDLSDELSEPIESEEETDENLTDLDADDLDLEELDSVKAVLAFLPCAAHNIQLVIKDGLVLDEPYTKLINHISRDIVTKSKVSTLIAEEIRSLELSLQKSVITRWNSILFMIRSVLKLSDKDFKAIRSVMRTKTAKQKEIKSKFCLSEIERDMLEELKTVLE